MNSIINPFARGYENLHMVRTLLITYADDCPPVWRQLHASQAHLSDDEVSLAPCLIGRDFAFVMDGPDIPGELESQCLPEGIVRTVVHAVAGQDLNGEPAHVGDTASADAALEVIHHLRFETGVYSRSWEISTAHLTASTVSYLAELADIATPTAFLFIAFRIPYEPAIGVKLIATPWIDAHLLKVEEMTVGQLRQEHADKGVPDDLADVLHLAAAASVRFLIFDADAPVLEGLRVYDA